MTGPFWFAFVGSAIILALFWRQLAHIAHADEEIQAGRDRAQLDCVMRPLGVSTISAHPRLRSAGCGGAGGR